MYLVAADTSGIQSYIFGSNRLRENIGASHLVKQVTGEWALDAVKAAAKLTSELAENNLASQPRIEDKNGAAAEVIYSGGGNVVVLFRDKPTAEDYMWQLSEQVLCEAPGLSLLLALSDEFDWKLDWDATASKFVVKGATAAAGVAIVKTHYPFARAYGLAEDLCDDAKKLRASFRDKSKNWDGSTLDWHYALSGLFGDLSEIRNRKYTVPAGSLTLRPVALSDDVPDVRRTWSVVEKGLTAFQSDSNWVNQRNKSKALRDALRGGPDAIKTFCEKYLRDKASNRQLPYVGGLPNSLSWRDSGWTTAQHDPDCQKHYSGYFDALELMDLYIPLHTPSNTSPQVQAQPQEAQTHAP